MTAFTAEINAISLRRTRASSSVPHNENALLIPQGIISENASGEQYIYVIKEKVENDEAKAEKTVIETGLTQGDFIEVTKGLQPGDEIIMEGARSVNDGQKVKIINQDS